MNAISSSWRLTKWNRKVKQKKQLNEHFHLLKKSIRNEICFSTSTNLKHACTYHSEDLKTQTAPVQSLQQNTLWEQWRSRFYFRSSKNQHLPLNSEQASWMALNYRQLKGFYFPHFADAFWGFFHAVAILISVKDWSDFYWELTKGSSIFTLNGNS